MFYRFVEHRTHKRHLRRSDLPHVWRWLPLPVLERMLGRMLVHKAFKPLARRCRCRHWRRECRL